MILVLEILSQRFVKNNEQMLDWKIVKHSRAFIHSSLQETKR